MDFIQRLIRYFAVVRKKAMRHRRLVTTCAAVVVFITAYALILPAITLDEETADQTPGISIEQSETTTEEKDAEATDASSTEEPDATTDETAKDGGSLITEPTTLSAEGAGYQATASVDGSAQLPASVALATSEVTESSDADAYKRYSDSALAQLRSQDSSVTGVSQARFFDVSFDDDGQEVEPQSEVGVTLSLDEAIPADSAEDVRVVHISDDGTASVLADDKVGVTVVDGKLSRVSFKSNRFSVYGVVVAEREAGDSQDSGTTDAQDDASDAQQLTHVLSASSDNYDVTISYDDDAGIPEGAKLSVDELSEGSDGYQAAKEAVLGSADADEGLGFVALDVTIRDADENIIEPSSGVAVSITAKGVPEDATSLEVRHIKDEDIVETVADATTGDVTLSDGTATASFDVDSFSTFTIRYTYYSVNTLSYIDVIDVDGKSIGSNKTYTADSADTLLSTIAEQANPNSKLYTFDHATLGDMTVSSNSASSYNVSYYYGDGWYLSQSTGYGAYINGTEITRNNHLKLYYSTNSTTGTYTASFWPNDGSGEQYASVTSDADGNINFPEMTKTRDGYTFSGWSTDQNANGSGAEHHRARVYQPGETATLTSNTTYYAIWSQNNAGSGFYIRLDGIIPTEPAAAGETSNYQNDHYTQGVDVDGALNPAHFYANQNGVDSHLSAQPTADQIVYMINNSTRSIGVNVRNDNGKVVVSSITNATTNAQYYNLSVGDELYVTWYVIKNAGNGPLVGGGNSSYAWHVDGVLLVRSKVNLTYDANAPTGSFANMPAGSQWNKGAQTVAGNDGGTTAVKEPTRNDGYRFVGWAEYVDTNDDHQFTDDEYVATIATNTSITMNHDTHLVAQWTKGSNFLTVSKTDTSGNVLAGAKFTLERKSETGDTWSTVSENLTTSSNGTFTYDDVTSQTVYRMTETYAPNGYETRNSFYFMVTTDPDDNSILGLYETDESGNVLSGSAKHDWVQVQYTAQTGTGGGVAQLHLTIKDEQIERKVQFVKEDQQGNKLSGAVFTLKNGDTDVTGVLKTEASGTDGLFSVDNASLPYGTYTLTETTAPANYETLKPITVTLNDPSGDAAKKDGTYTTGTGMTFSGDDADNASVSLTRTTSSQDNMQTTIYTYTVTIKDDSYTKVTVKKVANDADGKLTETALTGAKFTLTRRNASGSYEALTGIEGLGTDSSFTINNANGFTLNNLPAGIYKLTETAAPDGYAVLTSDIYFSVNAGKVEFTDEGGAAEKVNNPYTANVVDTTITVGNTPGTALPVTGGSGTLPYVLGGSALITLAIVGYALRRRSEGGDARS